jgi:hypothetical protein
MVKEMTKKKLKPFTAILLMTLFLLIGYEKNCIAQESEFLTGYIVTLKGDTIIGHVFVPIGGIDMLMDRSEIKFRTSSDQQKTDKVNAENIQRIQAGKYFFERLVFSYRTSEGEIVNENKLMLRLADGPLKLYKHTKEYYRPGTGTSPGVVGRTERYLIMRGNQKEYIRELSFRKSIIRYIGDCETVAQKVKEKIYKYKHLEKVVNEYNDKCSINN